MPLVQVIVLGIIQGLTEFLPISSTAHLVVIPRLLGWPDQGLAFDLALHLGTVAAVVLYFFRDWLQILAQGFGLQVGGDPVLRRNRGLLWLLAIGTVPIGIAGLLFEKKADQARGNFYLIGAMAIGVGLLLLWADRVGRKQKDIGHVSAMDSILIGMSQTLAIIPGTSRSGITISTGLLRNLDRETAARFSFLLLTPAVIAAAAKHFWDLMKHEGGIAPDMRMPFMLGIAVSAITGMIVIRFFLDYMRRRSYTVFVAYRIVFGIIVIALAFFRFGGG
ncbi:MAG TPA: undecaprenyl-diphosphatase UppP [Bryobacteraceae bacterium]|nr:undecaprenyl-diphosphatase UppP [Bryobacteraceae bacterium]